jgi:hypothetical protein
MRHQVSISTTEYQFSHGRSPRGRGSWAFQIGDSTSNVFWSAANQLYSDALKVAARVAVHERAWFVKVLP